MDAIVARRMWAVGEPIHAITYFADESKAAWAAAGLRGFWRGYFATRAAPMGLVGPGPVTAAFYNFAPSMVARAVPEVWTMATPAEAWAARLDGMDATLRAVVGDDAILAGPEITEAAGLARRATDACPAAGRVLYAAHLDLDWPEPPHLALWHALTLLREFRGDGHNAALLAANVDGCQAHVLAGATGGSPRDVTQPARGWTDEEWADAERRLTERGLLTPGRPEEATEAGRSLRDSIELCTDQTDLTPWLALGEDATDRLAVLLRPLSRAVVDRGTIRQPNPMGLTW
jgi:hypothetical protein